MLWRYSSTLLAGLRMITLRGCGTGNRQHRGELTGAVALLRDGQGWVLRYSAQMARASSVKAQRSEDASTKPA